MSENRKHAYAYNTRKYRNTHKQIKSNMMMTDVFCKLENLEHVESNTKRKDP